MDYLDYNDFINEYLKEDIEIYQLAKVKNPKVSILIQTYNHEDYIEECVLSVVNQKFDFEYEILIGEDYSTDNTRQVCMKLANQFPDKISLFLHKKENKIIIDGKMRGKFNLLYNFFNCRGEYCAKLDGDDYWIDSNKISKQYNFLNNSLDYNICYHQAYNEDGTKRSKINVLNKSSDYKNLLYKNEIASCTALYRINTDEKLIPSWFMKTTIDDLPFHYILSKKNKIKCLPDRMSVRRIHGNSIFSSLSPIEAYDTVIGNLYIMFNHLAEDEKPYCKGGVNRLKIYKAFSSRKNGDNRYKDFLNSIELDGSYNSYRLKFFKELIKISDSDTYLYFLIKLSYYFI